MMWIGLCLNPSPLLAQLLKKDSIDLNARYDFIQFANNAHTLDLSTVDTSLNNTHIVNPTREDLFDDMYLGNMGYAHQPIVFRYDKDINFNLGINQYNKYFFQPNDVQYYNSPYPLIDARYVMASKQEQRLDVKIAQPIGKTKRDFRYVFNFRRLYGPGQYHRQRSGYFNFYNSIWYNTPNLRYNLVAHYLRNTADVQQNGGIIDSILNNTDTINYVFTSNSFPSSSKSLAELWTANSNIKQQQIYLQQSYDGGAYYEQKINDTTLIKRLFPTRRIGYAFTFDNYQYNYTDTDVLRSEKQSENGGYFGSYYPNIFINSNETNDSIRYNSYKNEVFIAAFGKKEKLNAPGFDRTYTAKVSFSHQLIKIHQFDRLTFSTEATDTLIIDSVAVVQYDTSYYAAEKSPLLNTGILNFHYQNDPKNYGLFYRLNANYATFGYNWGDMSLDFFGRLLFNAKIGGIKGSFTFKRLTPNHIDAFYFSNHYSWNNDLSKINTVQIGATYYNPTLQLEAGYNNYVLNNYIIWNEEALPEQLSETVNISQITIQHHLNWRVWHLNNKIALQASTSKRIPLPVYYGQHRLYFENYLFKNALLTQIGIDLQTMSSYYANTFSPATGQFYLQSELKVPYDSSLSSSYLFYPVIDVFANFKINKALLFFKVQHLNQGLLPQKGYYATVNYPMPNRLFRFGVRWKFYD